MHDTRRTRLVLGVLIVAALLLITIDYRDGGSPVIRGIRAVSSSVFGGAETAANSASSLVGQGQGGSSPQVRSLQQEVVRLRAQLSHAQLSQAEYSQLRRLLSVAGKGGYRVVAANVIATGQGFQQTVTLDAGSRDGVRPRETVLNGQGLVGEVTAVGPGTCTVILATDSSAQVGIQLAPGGQLGWVTGPGKTASGTGELKLQVLDTHVTLTPGQQLVTSASVHDRPYVPGVPVGAVSQVVEPGRRADLPGAGPAVRELRRARRGRHRDRAAQAQPAVRGAAAPPARQAHPHRHGDREARQPLLAHPVQPGDAGGGGLRCASSCCRSWLSRSP